MSRCGPLDDSDAQGDHDSAFTEGWRLGTTGRRLVDDDLLPWPVRLRRPFIDGYRGGRDAASRRDEDLP